MARVATKAAVARKPAKSPVHDHDADWANLLSAVASVFSRHRGPLFTTDATGLNSVYLAHVPGEREIHDCYACRKFLENYGGLVRIGDDGHTASAFWDAETVPGFYHNAVNAMAKAVERAKVTGVFLSTEKTWGHQKGSEWTHFAVRFPKVYAATVLTAGQAMAVKREDHHTVARALGEYGPNVIAEAERLFNAEKLDRPERFLGPLAFMGDLHRARTEAKDARLRDNVIWKAVAIAPDGFCHIKSSVIGPLLDGIANGLDFHAIKARFEAMIHPLRYQRPTAAPKSQTLERAEKLFEEMGLAPALERRYARLDDCEQAWMSVYKKQTPAKGGVFGHLNARARTVGVSVNAPATVMTWEKFARTVLPSAERIEAHVSGAMPFIALTACVNEDAPPIFKWDNPVAWYLYHGGSTCSQWGLSHGWAEVTSLVQLPPMWGDKPQPHLGEGFILVLEGCADTRECGSALFPECLRNEVHGVRSVIEAYSRGAKLSGRDEASACGLDIRKGMKNIGYHLRVTSSGAQTDYKIDRWD